MSGPPLLELRGVTKRFPGVIANDDVSLSLAAGEVLGVLGENGAGKSTLMNILAGLVSADAGEILHRRSSRALSDAARRGRRRHRHGAPAFQADRRADGAGKSGARRAALGAARGGLWATRDEPSARSRRDSAWTIDRRRASIDLSIGQQQHVEILKALSRNPRILILDEPTSVLAPEERGRVVCHDGAAQGPWHRHHSDQPSTGRYPGNLRPRRRDAAGPRGRRRRRRRAQSRRSGADGRRRIDLPTHRTSRAAHRALRCFVVKGLTLRRPNGPPAVAGCQLRAARRGDHRALRRRRQRTKRTDRTHRRDAARRSAARLSITCAASNRPGPLAPARLRALGVAPCAEDRLRHGVFAAFSLTANWLLTNLWNASLRPRGWLRQDRAAHSLRRGDPRL